MSFKPAIGPETSVVMQATAKTLWQSAQLETETQDLETLNSEGKAAY